MSDEEKYNQIFTVGLTGGIGAGKSTVVRVFDAFRIPRFDADMYARNIYAKNDEDLFYAHIGGMDICAKTLLAVEKMINENILPDYVSKRYEDWDKDLGNFIHSKDATLEAIHQKVIDDTIEPTPRSGNQEYLENILNKYL